MVYKHIINVVSSVSAGVFAGGTLMIGVSFGLIWSDLTGQELLGAFPNYWKSIATTIIPFALLQTVLIPLSLYLMWQNKPARKLWIITLILWFANCTITSVYHFPVVLNSLDDVYSAAEITTVVDRWLLLHWPRVLLGLASAICAVFATMKSYKIGER